MKKPTKSELRRSIETSLSVLEEPEGRAHFPVRELTGVSTAFGPVFVGLDPARRFHLLLSIGAETHLDTDYESRGIHLDRRELVDDGETRHLVDLVCVMPRLQRLFVILASDVLERLLEAPAQPAVVAASALDDWRDLLARAAQRVDEARVRGVFGELHQLLRLVEVEPALVEAWRGPDNERHDLEVRGLAIEVKSKKRPGNVVQINGVEQLLAPNGGELLLVVQIVERDDSGSTLSELVDAIVTAAGNRDVLVDGLAKLGIDLDADGVRGWRFIVRDERAFRIEPGFPRIVPSDFVEGHVHPAVRSVAYTIDLASVSEAARTPEELKGFRQRMVGR